ncbi:radical SAM protein [Patescibacteria group bacterium]|nr:radical SAM protein [Patescibacteria group bacterium]
MRILFINPPSPWPDKVIIRDTNRSGRISSEMTIWPQVGLAMMAAMFPEDEVNLIDCIAEKMSYADLYVAMRYLRPEWVVFNPISSTFTHDMIVAHYAHSLGAKSVIISPLAEHEKEKVYERMPTLTQIIGYEDEPERTLYRIIKGEECKLRFEQFHPARQDLLPIGLYCQPIIGSNYTFVVTSRGCPYKCIYCRQTATWRGKVRTRSVESVLSEIQKYGLKNIAFHSDTFTLDHKWLRELCSKLPKGIRWICNSRVDTVTTEILKEMRRAGCWMICYGIESGNNRVLSMNQKGTTTYQAIKAVKMAKKAGLKVWGYYMVGMYGDTEESMNDTINLALDLPCDIVNFSIAAPYHGTKWHDISKENGWLKTEDWESFDQNQYAIVDQPNCSADTVKRYQKLAYRKWYLSWRGLKFASQFGLRNWKMGIQLIKNHL